MFDEARQTMRNWYPREYENFFGIILKEGESHTKDEALFRNRNVENYIVASAFGDWADWVPKGMVGVYAVRDADRSKKWFIVSAEEYARQRKHGFVIDLSKHQEIERHGQ